VDSLKALDPNWPIREADIAERGPRCPLKAYLASDADTENQVTEKFRALLATKSGDGQRVEVTELTDADIMEGDVTVAVEHSTVNYKDGLAVTGKAPIIRKFPLIPGIDLAGKVLRSEDPRFQPGDRVVANGWGLGETHHGGYAKRARLKGDWLIKLPDNISTAQAMAIGTAGYTAMLCVLALEKEELSPDKGDVLVTGAAGGWALSRLRSSTNSAIASLPPPAEPSRKPTT
jgi:acrylyl-CoA reductase (NADPH)